MTGTLSHGADAPRLREVGSGLGTLARRIVGVEQDGSVMAGTLRGAWSGPDLETFVSRWDASRQALSRAGESLDLLAEILHRNADEQDDASAGSGSGAGTAPAVTPGRPDDGGGSRPPEGVDADNNDSRDRPRKHYYDLPKPPEYYENYEDPGPGNVKMPKGADPEDPAIKEMLKTADGRAALDWMARNDIDITYDDDYDGAYYSNDTNSMTLGKDGYRDASTIIHEANHARWDAEDRQADVDNTSKEEYVNSKYDEETDCVTREVYYAKQAREEGIPQDVSVGEQKYDEGYERAYRAAIDAGKSPTEAHSAGDTAGRAEIRHLFSSGYYTVSGSEGRTYGEVKGEYWEKQNDWNPFNGL